MRVAEVMSDRVETVGAEESAEKALRRMRTRRIHHLVVMLGARAVGVVSARDLESVADPRSFRTVGEVMSAPAVTAEPHMTIRQAANLLRGRTIGCLPVLEDGKLVGILTATDMLEQIGKGSERPVSKGKRWVMKGRGPRRKALAVAR
jgi:acetoin utilization protein AcuB